MWRQLGLLTGRPLGTGNGAAFGLCWGNLRGFAFHSLSESKLSSGGEVGVAAVFKTGVFKCVLSSRSVRVFLLEDTFACVPVFTVFFSIR